MPRQTEDVSLLLAVETLAAKAELEKSGYQIPGRPIVDLPRLPNNLSEISDDDLIRLMTHFAWWTAHIAGLLALQEIDERSTDSIHELAFAAILSDIAPAKPSEGSMTKAKAAVTLHPQVRDAQAKKNAAYARRKLVKMMWENLERDAGIASRELTRRLARQNIEHRVERYRP